MEAEKKKLGRIYENGVELDAAKFIEDVRKDPVARDLLDKAKNLGKRMSSQESMELTKKVMFFCKNNCGVGPIFDPFATGRCPKCGGPVKSIAAK